MRAFSHDYPAPSSTSSSPVRPNVRSSRIANVRRSLARARAHNVGAAEGCGSTLRHLAVTTDGYTLDNPYGHIAVYTDVEGWRALAHSLQTRCREHFDFLGTIEERKAAESATDVDYPRWNALVERWNALAEKATKIDDTGGILFGSDVTEAIAFCTTMVSEQICFLEDVDAAIVGYGETPPSYPAPVKPAPPPTPPMDIAKAAITVVAVGVVGFLIVSLVKS